MLKMITANILLIDVTQEAKNSTYKYIEKGLLIYLI